MAQSDGPLNSPKPTTSVLVGGVFNATPPAPQDGQALALQQDSQGRLLVSSTGGGSTSNVNIADIAGNPPALTNPLPVELSDGTNAFGTAGNPLSVNVITGGGSNASVGSNGAAAPMSSTQVGGSDGANLQPLQVDGSKNLKTVVSAALPSGTNVIGHVIADSGSTTAVTGNVTVVQPTGTNLHAVIDSGSTTAVTQATASNLNATVVGTLTNNNAAPTGTNIGVLPARANAANPSWTEGDQVLASVDLSGHQRVVATGAAASGVAVAGNPVLIGGTSTGGTTTTITTDGGGGVSVGTLSAALSDAQSNSPNIPMNSAGASVRYLSYPYIFNGSTWDRERVSNIFKTAQATASGNTAVWTPTSGKKFRLIRLLVQLTDNASLASGAVLTIDLRDSNTTTNITFDVFVPTTAVTTVVGDGLEQQLDLGPNGILSAAANNVLNVNLSAALSTGNVRIIAMGCEE